METPASNRPRMPYRTMPHLTGQEILLYFDRINIPIFSWSGANLCLTYCGAWDRRKDIFLRRTLGNPTLVQLVEEVQPCRIVTDAYARSERWSLARATTKNKPRAAALRIEFALGAQVLHMTDHAVERRLSRRRTVADR